MKQKEKTIPYVIIYMQNPEIMTQMNLYTNKQIHREDTYIAKEDEGGGQMSGRLGLANANYYIWNEYTTKPTCTQPLAQGTI